MNPYRGNIGNLMQHWTFCEILAISNRYSKSIGIIDAHAMAPLANFRPKIDQYAPPFDRVAASLPGQKSVYENAWAQLAQSPANGYPNSANFLYAVWEGDADMILCETREETVLSLQLWAKGEGSKNRRHASVSPGDWRGIMHSVRTMNSDFLLLSFDPYMISRHENPEHFDPGNMYPGDFDLVGKFINAMDRPTIVQFSTYSANGDNSQDDVVPMVEHRVAECGLVRRTTVTANGNMMSMIFTRNVPWAEEFGTLGFRFHAWTENI